MRRLCFCLLTLFACTLLVAQPEPGSPEEKYEDIFSDYLHKGDFRGAIDQFKDLYKVAEKGDNDELKLGILSALGVCMNRVGQPDSALVYYSTALDLAREVGIKYQEANICVNLYILYMSLRRLDEARTMIEQGTLAARESDDPESLVFALETKGSLESIDERLEDAVVSLEECLDIA